MDFIRWLWNAITGFFGDMFYDLIGDALGMALVIGAIAVLVVPVYFILKKLGFGPKRNGLPTTYGEDLAELLHPPKPTPEQLEKVRKLDELGDKIRVVYRYLLVVVFVLGTWLAISLFRAFDKDPANKAFLQAYFGIAYIVFLLFVVGTFLAARPRVGRYGKTQPDSSIDDPPKRSSKTHTYTASFGMSLGSKGKDVSVDWSFGTAPLSRC